MKYNYETLKVIAKQTGRNIPELLAMHPSNDPFYVGSPSDIRDGQWFKAVFEASGLRNEHLRSFHYWLVSPKLPEPYRLPRVVGWKDKDTGKKITTDVYINNKACWEYLEGASLRARDLGLVDPDQIADNRTPAPDLNAYFNGDEGASYEVQGYNVDIPYLPELSADIQLMPYVNASISTNQPYLIEIWIEKSTLDKMLVPLCRRYGANLIIGIGYASATSIRKFLNRVRQANKPARILYISDYDKNGRKMPPAVSRRIEFLQRNDGYGQLDISVEPIVLTAEQIEKYDLPRSPDDGESVELDAMRVNYPDELRAIVEGAILRHYDQRLSNKRYTAQQELSESLTTTRGTVIDRHQEEIDALTAEYQGMVSDINGQLSAYQNRFQAIRDRLQNLSDTLLTELEEAIDTDIDLDNYSVKPETPGDVTQPLYKTGRDYLSQLEVYKTRWNGRDLDDE